MSNEDEFTTLCVELNKNSEEARVLQRLIREQYNSFLSLDADFSCDMNRRKEVYNDIHVGQEMLFLRQERIEALKRKLFTMRNF